LNISGIEMLAGWLAGWLVLAGLAGALAGWER
jgi:hypothetical protein